MFQNYHSLSDEILEINDRSSEKESNFIGLGRLKGKVSQFEVVKISVKGCL